MMWKMLLCGGVVDYMLIYTLNFLFTEEYTTIFLYKYFLLSIGLTKFLRNNINILNYKCVIF